MRSLTLTALPGIPEVGSGTALASLIGAAIDRSGLGLVPGDVLVVAQKIVSKAEGRCVRLDSVQPSVRAEELALQAQKDPRLMELVLGESDEVLRVKPGVVIVRHRLGFVMANAGVDQSNLAPGTPEAALLLPQDPDASACALQCALAASHGCAVGIVINDSFGRAWRNGVTGVAIGVAGLPPLVDLRGAPDRAGRPLRVTQIAVADELAAAASLVMGQAGEGLPVVLARGVPYPPREGSVRELLRPQGEDLFR